MKCGECPARFKIKERNEKVCRFNPFKEKGIPLNREDNHECDLSPELCAARLKEYKAAEENALKRATEAAQCIAALETIAREREEKASA